MIDFNEAVQIIARVTSTKERKNSLMLALKTTEECGELSEAVLSVTGAPGCAYKKKTWSDVDEEAVDVIICAFATAFRTDPDPTRLLAVFHEKLTKWQEKIG